MEQTHVALSLFFVLFVIILPLIIGKYKIKDNIKMSGTLPVGTAQFRAFLKLTGWLILVVVLLTLILNGLRLVGIDF